MRFSSSSWLPAGLESQGFSESKQMSLCVIVSHPNEHMGEYVVVRGTMEQLEHGVYLFAGSPCDEKHSGILIQGTDKNAYRAAGGRKGIGVLATVEGELVMSKEGVPEFIK